MANLFPLLARVWVLRRRLPNSCDTNKNNYFEEALFTQPQNKQLERAPKLLLTWINDCPYLQQALPNSNVSTA